MTKIDKLGVPDWSIQTHYARHATNCSYTRVLCLVIPPATRSALYPGQLENHYVPSRSILVGPIALCVNTADRCPWYRKLWP